VPQEDDDRWSVPAEGPTWSTHALTERRQLPADSSDLHRAHAPGVHGLADHGRRTVSAASALAVRGRGLRGIRMGEDDPQLRAQERCERLQRWRLQRALGDVSDIGDETCLIQAVEGDAAYLRAVTGEPGDLYVPREAARLLAVREALWHEAE